MCYQETCASEQGKTDSMQDIVKLVEPDEIHAYVRKLWKTDAMRKSHDDGGLVWEVIDRFARLPRVFYKPTDQGVEASHFSPWWGAIQTREYDNDVVQDLYYLHEIQHAGTMPYVAGLNAVEQKNKIRDNEHEASTLSEMTIYLEFPELRAKSFPHSIFVDRFLFPDGDFRHADVRMLQRWREEPDLVTKEMMYARANVLTSPDVDPADMAAFWLKRFYSQGKAWSAIWKDRYDTVERGMIKFRGECDRLGRAKALDNHIAWLQSPEIDDGTGIPFVREARAFADVYNAHKKLYFENIAQNGAAPVNYKPQEPPSAPQPPPPS